MGVTAAICTYIYEAFLVIKNALSAGVNMAKNVLKLVDSVIVAVTNMITYTISPAINIIINAVKVVQKQLVDMLAYKLDNTIFCKGIFQCIALLNELIDPDSYIFKLIKKIWKRECHSVIDEDLIEQMHDWINDFEKFRTTVCKYGFSFEFGISLIKNVLNAFKKQIESYVKWAIKKKNSIMKQLESYLDFCINCGIIDQLEKLSTFFLCVLDSSDSCASIATAYSYYADAMSNLGLEKQADGCYDISTSRKNTVYGTLEGLRVRCSNVANNLNDLNNILVNPLELNAANNAYNLSQNIFPANMKWSDFTKEDGSFSIGKVFNQNTWSKYAVYQRCKNLKSDWNNLVKKKKKNPEDELDLKELINGSFIDNKGNMYYKDGCDYIKIDNSIDDEVIKMDIYLGEGATPSTDVMVDPDTNQLISVTMAAIRINQNPKSKLAERCKEIWSFVNNWQMNADVVAHGAGVEKPI